MAKTSEELIEEYELNKAEATTTHRVNRSEVRESRSKKLFGWTLGFLIVLPFLVCGFIAYDAAKLNSVLNISGLEKLKNSMSSKDYNQLSKTAGLAPVNHATHFYTDRWKIIAAIFTVFIVIWALLIIGRIVLLQLRRSRDEE